MDPASREVEKEVLSTSKISFAHGWTDKPEINCACDEILNLNSVILKKSEQINWNEK